jgi:hypothetical protein
VAGMTRSLFHHVEQHVPQVALDEVCTRTRTVEIHGSRDGAGLLDLLPVPLDPVVHRVVLTDHEGGFVLASDGGPILTRFASEQDHLKPAALPGRGMLHEPQKRQRARGRGLSRRCVIDPLDLPDQALSLGIEEVFQGGTLRGEGELLVLVTRHGPILMAFPWWGRRRARRLHREYTRSG